MTRSTCNGFFSNAIRCKKRRGRIPALSPEENAIEQASFRLPARAGKLTPCKRASRCMRKIRRICSLFRHQAVIDKLLEMGDDRLLHGAVGEIQILDAVCVVEFDLIPHVLFDKRSGHPEEWRREGNHELGRNAFREGVGVAEMLSEDPADFDQLDFTDRYDMPPGCLRCEARLNVGLGHITHIHHAHGEIGDPEAGGAVAELFHQIDAAGNGVLG